MKYTHFHCRKRITIYERILVIIVAMLSEHKGTDLTVKIITVLNCVFGGRECVYVYKIERERERV